MVEKKKKKTTSKKKKSEDVEMGGTPTEYSTLTGSGGDDDGSSEGGCCSCIPWAHIWWILVAWTGVGFMIRGLIYSVEKIDNDMYKAISGCLCLPLFILHMQLFIAFFETGRCITSVAQARHEGGCCATMMGCLLMWSEWIAIILDYLMFILMSLLLMALSIAMAAMLILDSACKPGIKGMQTLCPVVEMVTDKHNSFNRMFGDLCTCPGPVMNSTGYCADGWETTSHFKDLCSDMEDSVPGSTFVVVGTMLLTAAIVGMFGASIRTRTKMGQTMKLTE